VAKNSLNWRLTGLSGGAKQGLYITLYPGPVQDDVYEHQNGKNYGQVEVDAAPSVTIHRQ
jgi:hypothetical protein